jgi:hypothetical protein
MENAVIEVNAVTFAIRAAALYRLPRKEASV